MVILLNKKALEEKMHFLQEFFFFFWLSGRYPPVTRLSVTL